MDPALALEIEQRSRYKGVAQLIDRGDSEIQQFYKYAVVFMTGGSGFLGQQIIEKLLRSTEVKKIYLLLRTKKQKTLQQRITEMTEEPVFENMPKLRPGFLDKIKAVAGDISKLRLGISDEDWNLITEEVTIIVHMAATVNFVEPIKTATLTNVRGTREMLTLGKACKRLQSFVHVSTAYAHATATRVNQPVLEEFYPSPVPPDTMIQFVENVDQNVLDNITPELLKPWPNTYTFTKAIAEEAVRTMAGDLPVCIVRPSIVISALQEPMPGWIDKSNAYGPSGLVLGVGLGVLHLIKADLGAQVDFVPVDYVNNAIIAAAYETAVSRERGDEDNHIKIYTVASHRNPLYMENMKEAIESTTWMATDKAVGYSFAYFVKNNSLNLILFWFYHLIPGYCIDVVLRIIGKKPIAVKIFSKVNKLSSIFSYFISNSWKFGDSNLLELRKRMSPTDQIIYQCDVETIDWGQYIYVWCLGVRKYLIRDGLNNTMYGVKKQKYLKVAHYIFMTLYIYTLWKISCVLFWILNSLNYMFSKLFIE